MLFRIRGMSPLALLLMGEHGSLSKLHSFIRGLEYSATNRQNSLDTGWQTGRRLAHAIYEASYHLQEVALVIISAFQKFIA